MSADGKFSVHSQQVVPLLGWGHINFREMVTREYSYPPVEPHSHFFLILNLVF